MSIPDKLSGGQQQRVAIARVLAHNPQLVLATHNPEIAHQADRVLRVQDGHLTQVSAQPDPASEVAV